MGIRRLICHPRRSKRVFILGPAHHIYLTGCALSKFKTYDTPLGELTLDLESRSPRCYSRDINSSVLLFTFSPLAEIGFIWYNLRRNCDNESLRPTAIAELQATKKFSPQEMTVQTDEDEHSIELHLPYVRKVFEATNGGMSSPCYFPYYWRT